MSPNRLALLIVGLAASIALSVQAQTPLESTTTAPAQLQAVPEASATRTTIEGYASHNRLSGGFGDWREAGVRATHAAGAHLLRAELAEMRRFRESGAYAGIGDLYTFTPDWFASLSVGAGDGASYLPRYRVDGFINRKLLQQKNLVATLGLAYYRAPDGHTDRSLGLGATYYFADPLVVQGEVRFNTSNPGNVHTHRQLIAATWGREKQTQLIGRVAWGAEGYQSIGAGSTLVNFRSREGSVALRHWLGPSWGVSAMLEHYRNPFYHRTGATVGLFWQMP